MKKSIYSILVALLFSMPSASLMAESLHEVKGKVYDNATGAPAVGIRVTAYNDRRYAAMTNEQGEYTIKVPEYVSSLLFSAEGYTRVQQPVKQGKMADVKMFSNAFSEIYADKTQATASKTAGATYLNNEVSIDPQLQNLLGGDMRTVTRSGVPGQGVSMLMNGINSLNGNTQPLVVLDGVVQDMQLMRPSLHDGFFNNLLANIMVEDIEKISVLKNGTALYGAKGANGVLVIETKRNKSMATKIDVSLGTSFELQPRLSDMMDGEQFRVYASELIGTTGTIQNSFKFLQTSPTYYYYKIYHNNTDWQNYVYDEALTQNYSINVQGGDEVANYNLSVGYADADATLKNNNFNRFNLRLNSDISLGRNANIRFDASYSDVTRDMRDDGATSNFGSGVISAPGFLSQIKSPFLSPFAFDSNGNESNMLAENDDYLSDVLRNNSYRTSLANPLYILRNGDGDNKNYFGNRVINLSVTPEVKLSRSLTAAEHFAFTLVNTDENYYLPNNGVPNYDVEGIGVVSNRASSLAARQIRLMSDTYLTYDRRFQAHRLNVRGGLRYLNSSYQLNTQTGYNSGNDKTPNMSTSLQYKSTDGVDDREIDMAYYLTAAYNYAERYYFSTALCLNGNSKFGESAPDALAIGGYGWGFFPSAEAAWVVSNEQWFKVSPINYLKLNVGYDILGNDDIDSNVSRTYFVAHKLLGNISGLTIGNIGNNLLQWETTHRATAGLTLTAFQNRLNARVNFFSSKTDGLVGINKLSYLSGMKYNWSNNGSLKNQGFDANVQVRLVDAKNFHWSMGASVGHYKNEVTSLSKGESLQNSYYGATILTQEGSPVGLFYGYKTDGVFATTEEAEAAGLYRQEKTGVKTAFVAGDMRFVDVDGNHEINEKDCQVIGDPNPDIYGNISTQLNYGHWTLSAVCNYSLGNDIYNYQRCLLESGSQFYNQTTALLRRWTHEGQVTDIPRLCYGDEIGNSRFSDRWIEDGSYIRLKNITLSYNLPIRSTYLQGFTVWAAANNLFTFTNYLGSDPEMSASNSVLTQGIDRGLLPQSRNFSVGLKINL